MTKVTLDMNTFKALASDTRLDILRALDGKNMSLNDICRATSLNKATLHEHLTKLNEAGLVKKNEREGHKWVYYRLTWKGEGLLHPENTKIVVMFSVTFISLFIAVIFIVSFLQPVILGMAETHGDTTLLYEAEGTGIPLLSRSYDFNYVAEVNATDQTVDFITYNLQIKAMPRNAIGQEYKDDEIFWITPGNIQIDKCQNVVESLIYSPLNETYGLKDEFNDTDNDTTNKSLGFGDGAFYECTPVIPEMIAVAQDPTSLYIAIACIVFFGASFTLSSWKFWKNRTPKL